MFFEGFTIWVARQDKSTTSTSQNGNYSQVPCNYNPEEPKVKMSWGSQREHQRIQDWIGVIKKPGIRYVERWRKMLWARGLANMSRWEKLVAPLSCNARFFFRIMEDMRKEVEIKGIRFLKVAQQD